MDLNIPRADEIIREVGDKIIEGIEALLETATCEHTNIQLMKHLLRTASFAKKFVDPNEFDANRYVNIVKHMVILTKLRHSSCVTQYLNINSVREQSHISNLKSSRRRMCLSCF